MSLFSAFALAEELAWLSARTSKDLVATNIRARFNINTLSYPYRGYHYKDKTRPPCPHLMPRIPMQYISWYVYTDHLLVLHRYWVIMGSCMGNNPDKYGFMEHINLLSKNTWATAKQPKSNPFPCLIGHAVVIAGCSGGCPNAKLQCHQKIPNCLHDGGFHNANTQCKSYFMTTVSFQCPGAPSWRVVKYISSLYLAGRQMTRNIHVQLIPPRSQFTVCKSYHPR